MSKPTLAQLLIESARKAQEEQEFNKRVAAIAQPEIDKILAQHKAETSKRLSCPSCGEPLPESWRTDEVTRVSDDNEDEDNEGDRPDDDVEELDAVGKSKVVAQLLANRQTSQIKLSTAISA